jgi:UDP-N-acetylmuramoylalanine--D-glutamate ligase
MQGQSVLVLGLGASGLAMARWCARLGAVVTVADTRTAPPQLAALQESVPAARFVSGALDAALLEGGTRFDAIFKSPGLAPKDMSGLLQAAHAAGIAVRGELSLFSQGLRALQADQAYAPKVLAVTGTNGKTTVTSLTGHLLRWAGLSVGVAGNIGPTLLDTLAQALDDDALPQAWVLELSSFQLDGVDDFEPTAAVVLNLTQDHLDWHADMAEYGAAKARIFGKDALMVLNREDAAVMAMLSTAGPPQGAKAPRGGSAAHAVASVGAQMKSEPVRVKLQRPQHRAHVTFGCDLPQRPSDFGLEEVNGMVWLVRAHEADETLKRRRDEAEEIHLQRLMPADALRIRGRHNAANALAALALCAAAGCTLAPMLYGLREYRGEPHRVESVGILHEVEFFDDSKGTNVGATVAALRGLGEERKLVLILGGVGKGQDFSPLADPVARYARAVVVFGQDAPVIRAALETTGVPLLDASDMGHAVAQAQARAHAGDAVLMSPACASFDMFRNYEHRAQVFCDAVRTLAADAGVDMETQA